MGWDGMRLVKDDVVMRMSGMVRCSIIC